MNTSTRVCALLLVSTVTNGLAQPIITKQPTNQSVSLGASAKFQVSARTTAPPISYQWRLASASLDHQTSSSLSLTNIQVINAGEYDAVVTDGSGSVTSRVAHLEVDPTFTKVTVGGIVTDLGSGQACAWGDYDNDGFIDLYVTNSENGSAQKCSLYHNNGDGTFTRITNTVVSAESRDWRGCAWGDYDNDGNLDLMVI